MNYIYQILIDGFVVGFLSYDGVLNPKEQKYIIDTIRGKSGYTFAEIKYTGASI